VALFTTLETDEEIDEAMLEALEEPEDAAVEADPPAPLAVLVPVVVASESVMADMGLDALLTAVVVNEQERTRSLTSGYVVSKSEVLARMKNACRYRDHRCGRNWRHKLRKLG